MISLPPHHSFPMREENIDNIWLCPAVMFNTVYLQPHFWEDYCRAIRLKNREVFERHSRNGSVLRFQWNTKTNCYKFQRHKYADFIEKHTDQIAVNKCRNIQTFWKPEAKIVNCSEVNDASVSRNEDVTFRMDWICSWKNQKGEEQHIKIKMLNWSVIMYSMKNKISLDISVSVRCV